VVDASSLVATGGQTGGVGTDRPAAAEDPGSPGRAGRVGYWTGAAVRAAGVSFWPAIEDGGRAEGSAIVRGGAVSRWARLGVVGFALLAVLAGCGRSGSPGAVATARPGAAAISATPAASAASPSVAPSPAAPVAATAAGVADAGRPLGPPIAPTPGSGRSTFRSATAEIGPVVWATELEPGTNAPRAAVEIVPAEAPAIYATVPVLRLEPGAVLTASWSYNGTPLPAFDGRLVADRGQAGGWAEFHIARSGDAPWPPGVYSIAVAVDGQVAQEAAVLVGE